MAEMDYEQEPQVLVMESQVKPGYATTEFWLTVATAVSMFGASLGVDAEWLRAVVAGFGSLVVVAYGLWRTLTKRER